MREENEATLIGIMSANKIVLKSGLKIGESCAEDDHNYLEYCFIEKEQLERLIDLNNNGSILLGRTGAGKTAILSELTSTSELRVTKLDPEALFFQYVSNSKTFDFFAALDANLDVIFSLLWKHILLIEAIKLYFESKNSFDKALAVFSAKEKDLKKYLEKFDSKFWTDSEVSMQEIITKIENSLKGSAGVDVEKIKLGAEGARKITTDEKVQIRQNIHSAVNTPLNSLLHKAISDLNMLTSKKKLSYYIVLDELDENWIANDFKYRLIRALIESIRKFRKVRKIKIIVAMRNDLYEKTVAETADAGFQAEKHDGLIVKLSWNRAKLLELVEARIEKLFQWKYTKSSVRFSHIFPDNIRKTESFNYLLDRTLMRPRDLIEFINTILEKSSGMSILGKNSPSTISAKRITDAEETYSLGRKQAVIEEWATVHPQLEDYINLLNSLKENFSFENQDVDEKIDDIVLNICANESVIKDSARLAADKYLNIDSNLHKNRLKQEIFSILYKVGIISIKLTKGGAFKNSFQSNSLISPTAIGLTTKLSIRPMFWRALGTTPNIGNK